MKILSIIIIILLIVYLLASYILFLLVSRKFCPKLSKHLDEKVGIELKKYQDIIEEGQDWVQSQKVKHIFIKYKKNPKIHAIYINNPKSDKIMILSHGYRSTAFRDVYPSCHEYYKMGFSLLIIDQRTSNKSEGKYITYGYKEKIDLLLWINYLSKKYKNKKIILAGVSMGATTSLLATELTDKVTGVIADSGYINAYEEIDYTLNKFYKIPTRILMPAINLWNKLINGFDYKDVDTKKALENTRIPILFVHGRSDIFIPMKNSIENYDKYKGEKMLLTIPKANHGMSYLLDKDKYIQTLKEYLKLI